MILALWLALYAPSVDIPAKLGHTLSTLSFIDSLANNEPIHVFCRSIASSDTIPISQHASSL
jgi:hypothetical protein